MSKREVLGDWAFEAGSVCIDAVACIGEICDSKLLVPRSAATAIYASSPCYLARSRVAHYLSALGNYHIFTDAGLVHD